MSVRLTRRDEFKVIIIDRPDALNALNTQLLRELETVLGDVGGDDARAVLITGAGNKAFCAGADVKELQDRSTADHRAAMEYGQRVFSMLERLHIPSLAVINGYAYGGGLELALACDFRIATSNATMGLPEIKLGLIPGYGGTQRLPRLVGEARALELVMTGRTVDAEEALRIGLVTAVVAADSLDAGLDYARQFSVYSMPVVACARSAVKRALDTPLGEGMKIEADLSALAYQTKDAAEGMSAFVAKRPPRFEDR